MRFASIPTWTQPLPKSLGTGQGAKEAALHVIRGLPIEPLLKTMNSISGPFSSSCWRHWILWPAHQLARNSTIRPRFPTSACKLTGIFEQSLNSVFGQNYVLASVFDLES